MSNFKRVINVVPLTAVSLTQTQIFTYLVPLELYDLLKPGMLVNISFGKRRLPGAVSSFEMHRLPAEAKGLKAIESIIRNTSVLSEQNLTFANFLARHFVSPLGLVLKTMLPKFVRAPKDPGLVGYEKFDPDFILTDHQRQAVSQIISGLDKPGTFLLHGVTGSGKTEVYMQVTERLISNGKQVIMLVPEISLTTQAIERFARRFGIEKIALLGSHLNDAERLWMWLTIQSGEKQIIIGPRSAVFAPVRDLGLIIMDEEHDPSFKQYDQKPKYHARTAARKLAEIWGCPLVLGDATPEINTYFFYGRQRLVLPHRIMADVGLPKVRVVDMRREIAALNFSIFSEALKSEIVIKVKSGKQIILFLNRRGSATFVMCRDCGFVSQCRDCQVSLVYHLSGNKLLCHHCAKSYPLPEICPSCKGSRIKYFGIGTEAVEVELKKFLLAEQPGKPLPEITRMDRDSTNRRGAHDEIYNNWTAGRTQILIGTQMVSKGWDVTQVGLVGIISADTILHLPDYRANERTFQILTQVAGRAGRGADPGVVILQTYNPDNFAIQAAKRHDYDAFYLKEIEQRRKFGYPPFTRLALLTFSHTSLQKAEERAAEAAAKLMARKIVGLEVVGPVPSFITRLRGRFRYQVILKAPASAPFDFYPLLQNIPYADIDVDPESLL